MLEISNVNVHVLELIALPMALILLSTSIRARMTVANKAAIGAYAVASSAVLGSILISGLVAMDPGAVLLKGVLKWVEIIGLSWVVLTYCSSMRRFQQIWIILILTTLLTIVGTFYLDFVRPYFSGEFTSWPRSSVILTAFRRISGADALLVVVLTAPFRARRWGRLMGLVCLALTLLSLSRTAAAGLVASLGYLLWRGRSEAVTSLSLRPGLGVVLVVLALLWGALNEVLVARATEVLRISLRLELARAAWDMFVSQPLTGVGAENFGRYLLYTGIFPEGHGMTPNLAPHSVWLQTAAETGLIGFLALLTWFGTLCWIVWRRSTFHSDSVWLMSLRLAFIVQAILLTFGYVAGGSRLQLALFAGLSLAAMRPLEGRPH